MKPLIVLHVIANALLLWLGYEWLSVGESSVARLLWSAFLALFLIALAAWLHGTSCVFFRSCNFSGAGRVALRHLPAMLVVVLVGLILYALVSAIPSPAFKIASYLTLHLRKPVKPNTMQSIFNALLWIVRWVILPVLLAPRFVAAANSGWRLRTAIRRSAWLFTPALLLAGLWLPLKLIGWVPRFDAFSIQMTSFLIRAALAYALFTASWIVLARLTSRPVKV